MSHLEIISDKDGTLLVSSETIAEGSGAQHASVLRLIDDNRSDLDEFGRVRFEIRPFATAGGMQERRVALLDEQQTTLLMTYQRNTEQVRQFKKALVRAFYEMTRRLATPVPEDDASLVARALQASARMLEQKDAQIAVLEPRAQAWDELADASGDYEVADAAKILARAGIETGRQRLFDQLAELTWIYRNTNSGKWKAYQSAVDAGYLAERPQSHHHPRTGEKVIDPPQVRVTIRGLERLRVRLGRLDAPALHAVEGTNA